MSFVEDRQKLTKFDIPLLETGSAQDVFNYIANHLIKQGQPSMGGFACLYRNPDGLSCAAGCLIPDDQYDPNMEGESWDNLVNIWNVVDKRHLNLIMSLQGIHDDWSAHKDIDRLLEAAERIAKQYKINWKRADESR